MAGLVLGRRCGESIQIDGPCTVVVDRIKGDTVRLRILADKSVHIARTEILPADARKGGSVGSDQF